MPDPDTISADYTLRPSELAATLKILVEARQPVMVWGGPGIGKSEVAQQVAAEGGRAYYDVRALLLDPVDLRGIPWRDDDNRTRWAPPDFLPPTDSTDLYLVNLEELPSGVPMVQAALFQLVRDRKCGEYELPEGASLMACGNREGDRGITHRMPTPLASRFVHLEIKVDPSDWCEWGAANGIAPETLFFIQLRPELLNVFDPQSREAAFACPRAEARLDVEWSDLARFGRVRPTPAEPTDEEKAEIERLHTRHDELVNMDEDAWTDELIEEAEAIEPRLAEIQDAIKARAVFKPEDIAIAGCIVTVGNDGTLQVVHGLVKPEDMPADTDATSAAASHGDAGQDDSRQATSGIQSPSISGPAMPPARPDPEAEARKEAGVGIGLADDLRAVRTALVKAHLADDFGAAFDLIPSWHFFRPAEPDRAGFLALNH